MFGKNKKNAIAPEVQSMIDKTIRKEIPQKLKSTVGTIKHLLKVNRDNKEITTNLIEYTDSIQYRLTKLEQFLKVEYVEEQVSEYRKITKSKK